MAYLLLRLKDLDMGSFSRRLGLTEHLFATLHSLGAMLYVNIAHIQGAVPFEILRTAINLLQERHPLLQTHLQKSGDSFYFVSGTGLLIPLQVIEQEYKQQWLEIAQGEMLRTFSDEEEPLCRITFVQAKEKTDTNQLIVTFHHAIAAGSSALHLIDELLSYCCDLAEGVAITPPEAMPLQPPLEQFLERYLSNQAPLPSTQIASSQADSSPTLIIEETTTSEHRETHLITRLFSRSLTQHLQDRCRQEQTTVHGALCTAMLIAASTETLKTSNPSLLSCSSNVDLRVFCHPPVAQSQLGCFVSAITTTHFLDSEPDFWQLARDCRSNIRQMIDSKVPHYQVSNPELLKKYQVSFLTQMAEYNMGRNTATHVSNLGKFYSKSESECFRLKEFYFATGQHIVGTCLWLGVVTLNNQMNCTFAHVEPLLSKKTAELLINNVIMTLENAVI
ncbi:hypothetical protein H6F43_08910 [Leptolyngbya sp. FACHB-36]|uniref:phthiocerol/phthiodiolone dimycocerosyl transferase family protein n=1 Tax=Leptolyngbya sp. FACHB-36 TaxID=2692808 RepID=UPI001680A49B|nr:condensation domain-containing protein [Leptolyngbya sp. FACHB-36]MBD2020304.1 hypothetical protein [Leptolyngbya sp. FACHB-36]